MPAAPLQRRRAPARAGTVGTHGLTFDGNDRYVIPDSSGLNLSPVAARTLTFTIETGADIGSMQVRYTSKAALNSGLSIVWKTATSSSRRGTTPEGRVGRQSVSARWSSPR